MTDIANLWRYDLRKGNSEHPREGACLFDAGMWLVYGRIGDNPPCSCPVIRAYAIGVNDRMSDAERQRLKPFILRVVGNRDPEAEPARLHHIVLETARRIVPLVVKPTQAARLRVLPDDASYEVIRAAANAADAADAARAAAAYAAYDDAACDDAAYAADRAAAAAAAAETKINIWSIAIDILDGALRIGKQSPEFDEAEVRRSVAAFAEAAAT